MSPAQSPDFHVLAPLFEEYSFLEAVHADAPFTYKVKRNDFWQELFLDVVPASEAGRVGWNKAFMEKARKAVMLQHPALMKVVDVGERGGFLYMVTEYSSDPTLKDARGRLPFKPAAALMCVESLVSALKVAHDAGIVNGRLNPGMVHINDRNFVRVLPINPRSSSMKSADREFCAPETAKNDNAYDASDDAYSVGMILYLLLTGGLPSTERHLMPSNLCDCSKEADEVVSRAISPSKSVRFRSLDEMRAALDSALAKPEKDKRAASLKSSRKPLVIVDRGKSLTYFFLIPFLLIALVMAYVSLNYLREWAAMRTEYNELVRKQNKENEKNPIPIFKD